MIEAPMLHAKRILDKARPHQNVWISAELLRSLVYLPQGVPLEDPENWVNNESGIVIDGDRITETRTWTRVPPA